jgi:hypothetical protein
LALATSRESCTADAQTAAKPLFDGIRAYAAAYEKGAKPADVANLTIVPHKTAAGSAVAYFLEVRPNFPRPPGAPQNGAGGGRRGGGFPGAGGFPGGGGPGGGPPGGGAPESGPPPGGGDVSASSQTAQQRTPEQEAARRAFLNSPALKAYRGFVGCAYITILSQSEAKAKGIVLEGGRFGLLYVPGTGIVFVQALQLPQGGGSLKSGS